LPINVYGNLERIDGYIDGDVEFRMADVQKFDLKDARFCISYLPQNREPIRDIFKPPPYVENCLGIDPIQKWHERKLTPTTINFNNFNELPAPNFDTFDEPPF